MNDAEWRNMSLCVSSFRFPCARWQGRSKQGRSERRYPFERKVEEKRILQHSWNAWLAQFIVQRLKPYQVGFLFDSSLAFSVDISSCLRWTESQYTNKSYLIVSTRLHSHTRTHTDQWKKKWGEKPLPASHLVIKWLTNTKI